MSESSVLSTIDIENLAVDKWPLLINAVKGNEEIVTLLVRSMA